MSNLYIVATPIGNLQDVSLRAARILLETQIIIAESPSKTGILLEFLHKTFPEIKGSTPKIISFTEDEEENKIPEIIRLLEENDATIISEAGTPLISDPGFKLVREAIKRKINVISVPGPTSVIAALTTSGLAPDKFLFLGYLPKKVGNREEALSNLKKIRTTITVTAIFLESPHRLVDGLSAIQKVFGDIDIVICRELTKIHEEIRREKTSEAIKHFTSQVPRGEFILIF